MRGARARVLATFSRDTPFSMAREAARTRFPLSSSNLVFRQTVFRPDWNYFRTRDRRGLCTHATFTSSILFWLNYYESCVAVSICQQDQALGARPRSALRYSETESTGCRFTSTISATVRTALARLQSETD